MRHDVYLWLSKKLYFPTSNYFRFFAKLIMNRWKPEIIVVMGSAGKSNAHRLFHALLSQKHTVRQSQKANSAFAIPLDIADIHVVNYSPAEWIGAAFKIPFRTLYLLAFPYPQKYYIVELDVDRPGEMAFFASFIKPKLVFWVSSYATHTANFDKLAKKHKFMDSASALAFEFAKIFKESRSIIGLVNADSDYITQVLKGRELSKYLLRQDQGKYYFFDWQIFRKRTVFKLKIAKRQIEVELPFIAPRNFGYTLLAAYLLADIFKLSEADLNRTLSDYSFNPGICSILNGFSRSKIIDSSYNSSLYATKSLLEVLHFYPGKRKIAVLGDMRDLGAQSESEHQKIAQDLLKYSFDQVVLVGEEMHKYVNPKLAQHYQDTALHYFQNTYQAGLFIKERLLKEGDVVLLKASQNTLFFEIIAELLLANQEDLAKLCRRAPVWEAKRLLIKNAFYSNLNL